MMIHQAVQAAQVVQAVIAVVHQKMFISKNILFQEITKPPPLQPQLPLLEQNQVTMLLFMPVLLFLL